MKSLSVFFARLSSLSWHFFQWSELAILSVLVGGVGHLIEKIVATLGPRFPQFSAYWPSILAFSQRVIIFSERLITILIVLYVAVVLMVKFARVKIIRSSRMSHHLREMLMTTVDQIPKTDENRRDKAKNVSNERANKSVKKSFVLVRQNEILTFVRIPRQIETRKILLDYLGDVADDLSRATGMTSSAWQDFSNPLTFSIYKIMSFHR